MTVYSNSRINTFENCPQQYKFRYLDKIQRDFESIEAYLGKRFHEVMEKLYAEAPAKLPAIEALLAYYEKQWESQYHPAVIVVKKDKSAQEYRAIGRQCIESYYQRHFPFNQSKTLGIEHKVFFSLDHTGKYQLIGFIDRLSRRADGVYEIHDYKTSASLPPVKSFETDRQLGLYQLAVQNAFPDAKAVELIWHYVAVNEDVKSTRTADDLDLLRQETIGAINLIEKATIFPANESRLCDWCAYQDICPAKQSGRNRMEQVTRLIPQEKLLVDQLSELALRKQGIQNEIKAMDREIKNLMQQAEVIAGQKGVSILSGTTHSLKISEDKKMSLHPNGN